MLLLQTIQSQFVVTVEVLFKRLHRIEPLKDRCFDFINRFKHSELTYFAYKLLQQKKSKTERQIIVRLFSSLT